MKIIVSGSTGRVGKELLKLIRQNPPHQNAQHRDALHYNALHHKPLYRSAPHQSDGFGLAGFINRQGYSPDDQHYTPLNKASAQADVVIDFSLPAHLPALIKFCAKNKLPLVSGTTGLKFQHIKALDQLGLRVPLLWAPNMSLGIYFLHQVLRQHFAVFKDDFQFTISETHHVHKKDTPSGTALLLQQTVLESTGQDCPPQAHRQGEVFGEHTVQAESKSEIITLSHKALNRSVFARGALKVAQNLYTKPAGCYTLKDILEGPPSNSVNTSRIFE